MRPISGPSRFLVVRVGLSHSTHWQDVWTDSGGVEPGLLEAGVAGANLNVPAPRLGNSFLPL